MNDSVTHLEKESLVFTQPLFPLRVALSTSVNCAQLMSNVMRNEVRG